MQLCNLLLVDYMALHFIGEINTKRRRVIKYKSYLRNDVATAGNDLFVLRRERYDDPNALAVYDADTFTFRRLVTVDGMTAPRCLAACSHYKCLYIGDNGRHRGIHRVDLSTNQITRWSVDGRPTGLSVTRRHTLLVTLYHKRAIFEYTTHGSLLRNIKLDVNIGSPVHAVELSNGQFVVNDAISGQDGVCVVDTAGHIVHSYDRPKDSFTRPSIYTSLAVDSHDNMFVADYDNDRVELLSATLTHLGYVATHGLSLHYETYLHLDELRGRLYIGAKDGLHVITARRQVTRTSL